MVIDVFHCHQYNHSNCFHMLLNDGKLLPEILMGTAFDVHYLWFFHLTVTCAADNAKRL